MFDWFDLDEAAAIIKDATGKQMGARDLLRMAFAGELKVSSVIPGWVSPGVGDLVFYGLSGDSDARGGARMTSVTDGFFRHLEAHDFQALRNHGRLPLAGKTVVLRGSDGTEARWVIGPEAPNITLGDLRVSAAEVARIEAELRGEPQQRKKTTPAAVNDAESAQTPTRRAVIIKSLGRKYPALASALDRPEEWAKACRIPKEASPDGKHGWYYLERIEAECRRRYGGAAPEPAADLSLSAQLSRISR